MAAPSPEPDLRKEADRVVVVRYGPPGVIVSQELDVLGFRGKTGRHLDRHRGSPASTCSNSCAKS